MATVFVNIQIVFTCLISIAVSFNFLHLNLVSICLTLLVAGVLVIHWMRLKFLVHCQVQRYDYK